MYRNAHIMLGCCLGEHLPRHPTSNGFYSAPLRILVPRLVALDLLRWVAPHICDRRRSYSAPPPRNLVRWLTARQLLRGALYHTPG